MRKYGSRSVLLACILAELAVGFLNYRVGYEFSIIFFYMPPLIVAAFACGSLPGYFMAVLCTVCWAAADWFSGHPYRHLSLFVWNAVIRMLSFLTVAYLAGRIPQEARAAKPPVAEEPELAGPPGDVLIPYQNRLSGGNKVARLLWTVCWFLLFRPSPLPLHAWRRVLLRCFGARVGRRCRIDPSCRIWAPWNLTLGDDCTLESYVDCYSVDQIMIGARAVIGRYAYLCGASHDTNDPALFLTFAPIRVAADAWIGARTFVRPGVTVGAASVVCDCAVVTRDIEPRSVVVGNPARVVRQREAEAAAGGSAR